MKTFAVASLLSIVSVVSAAGICFLVADSGARTAEQELAAFSEHAQEEAQKGRIFPVSPQGTYIVSMVPPAISPSDRAHIDALQFRYESLIYRRDLAAWSFTRGVIVAIVIAGFCWFPKKPKSNQTLQPTPGS